MASGDAYKSNREIRELSQAERDDYVRSLTDRGLDDGPEWDRIYRLLERLGDL